MRHRTKLSLSNIMKHGESDVKWQISIQGIHLSAFWNNVWRSFNWWIDSVTNILPIDVEFGRKPTFWIITMYRWKLSSINSLYCETLGNDLKWLLQSAVSTTLHDCLQCTSSSYLCLENISLFLVTIPTLLFTPFLPNPILWGGGGGKSSFLFLTPLPPFFLPPFPPPPNLGGGGGMEVLFYFLYMIFSFSCKATNQF